MSYIAGRKLAVLDFDIENRPLSYWADRPTAEVTAIAACWAGFPKSMRVWLLGTHGPEETLVAFREMYNQADMVTGHYIRMHDLPILSGASIELLGTCLPAKLTEDTKNDLVKRGDLPATQEYLAAMMGVKAVKKHMTQADWREANRLTPDGLRLTEARVTGDVIQHMALRVALRDAGLLRAPRMWNP
jgi:hypothetical protein